MPALKEEIANRLLDIAHAYSIELKQKGSKYWACCPLPGHSEKTPSFYIDDNKNLYFCQGCKSGGNSFGFIQEMEGYPGREGENFVAILEKGAALLNLPFERKYRSDEEKKADKEVTLLKTINKMAAQHYAENLFKPENKKALEYLTKRFLQNAPFPPENRLAFGRFLKTNPDQSNLYKGFEKFKIKEVKQLHEFFSALKLGWAENGNDFLKVARQKKWPKEMLLKSGVFAEKDGKLYDRFYQRITFPVCDIYDHVIAFTGRTLSSDPQVAKAINTKDTPIFSKSNALYLLNKARRAAGEKDMLYLAEGGSDAIRLHNIGKENTAAQQGTALSTEQLELIKRFTNNITLIYDGDAAGRKALVKNSKHALGKGMNVYILPLPDGEDPDSYFWHKDQFDSFEKANKEDFIFYYTELLFSKAQGDVNRIDELIQEVSELIATRSTNKQDLYISRCAKITETSAKSWKDTISFKSKKFNKLQLNKKSAKKTKKEIVADNSPENRAHHSFYFLSEDNKGNTRIHIEKADFLNLLKEEFGFYRYDIDEESYAFIQIIDNRIYKTNPTKIKTSFVKYVKELNPIEKRVANTDEMVMVTSDMIEKEMIKKSNLTDLFGKDTLELIFPDYKIEIKRDTLDKKYFFFENGYLEVSKDGAKLLPYKELDGYIWGDMVLPRKYEEPKSEGSGYFEKFFKNVCNNDPKRIKSLMVIAGYLLHNFMDRKLYEIIATDARISEDGGNKGRSGKSFFIYCLGMMLNHCMDTSTTYVEIQGKEIDLRSKSKYDNINIDTTLVHFDDIYRGFQIEHHYNMILSGIKVGKLYKDHFVQKCKIYLSTNKTIPRENDSDLDRTRVFEFADYYKAGFGPDNEFGHRFFRDWKGTKADQWDRYHKFIIDCCIEFFRAGGEVKEPPVINLHRRELFDNTAYEFVTWMDFLCAGNETTEPYFQANKPIDKKELFLKFKAENGDFNNDKFKQRKFTQWLKLYLNKSNMEFSEHQIGATHFIEILYGLPAPVKKVAASPQKQVKEPEMELEDVPY